MEGGLKPGRYAERLAALCRSGVLFDEAGAAARRGGWRAAMGHGGARSGEGGGPLVVEVGCADGALLREVAGRWPGVGFVGVDWTARGLCVGGEGGLPGNVRLVWGRAQRLGGWFAPGELTEVWLFHPDRPAVRDDRRRGSLSEPLVTAQWLGEVARVLGPGGRFVLKTDDPGYFQQACRATGLAEPGWFGVGRDDAGKRRGLPRTKWGDVLREEELPGRSELAAGLRVCALSYDLWGGGEEAKVRSLLGGKMFGAVRTRYESRFSGRGFPIYYLELEKA